MADCRLMVENNLSEASAAAAKIWMKGATWLRMKEARGVVSRHFVIDLVVGMTDNQGGQI